MQIKRRFLDLQIETVDCKLFLIQILGHEGLDSPFQYDLTWMCQDGNLAGQTLLGKSATVIINGKNTQTQVINGIIRTLEVGGVDQRGIRTYRASIHSWFELLDDAITCRIYRQLRVAEIISAVFAAYHIADFDLTRLRNTYPRRDYCVRYREGGFSFVTRLLAEEGISYYFQHEQDKHTLILFDKHTLLPKVPNDFDMDLFHRLDGSEYEWGLMYRSRKMAHVDVHNPESLQTLRYHTARLKTTYLGLHPGMSTAALQLGTTQRRGKYTIASISQYAYDDAYAYSLKTAPEQSKNTPRIDYYNELHFHPVNDYPSRQPSCSKPERALLQQARVIGPKEQAVHTDVLGCIKVQFDWERQSSAWIPVRQIWTGDKWGALFIPRVGETVLVDFMEADPDRPIVLGVLPSKAFPAPFPQHWSGVSTGLKTFGGHLLSLDGAALCLHSQGDCNLLVKHDYKQTMGGDSCIEVETGKQVLDVQGEYRLQAGESIHLMCGNSEIILQKDGIQLRANSIYLN